MVHRSSVTGLTEENSRVCEWGKATQTSSPVWYLYVLGLKDTPSCGVPAAHHLTQSMAGAPTYSQPRALLPNREQCRTRQEAHSTFPGTGPSRTAHPKSCPFPLGSTPLCLLPLWQQHSGAAALQAGGCPARRRHTQGCAIAPPAKQRALQISPVLNTYLRPSQSEQPHQLHF